MSSISPGATSRRSCCTSSTRPPTSPKRGPEARPGRSIIPLDFQDALLAHPGGLAGEDLPRSFEVGGERAGGDLLQDLERGHRALAVADQDLRELQADLVRDGGEPPAV